MGVECVVRGKNMKKLMAVTLTVLLLIPARTNVVHSAASWTVFQNRVFRYSLSYPAIWLRTPTQGLDLVAHSADKNAGLAVVAVVHQRRMTSAAVQNIAASEIYAVAGSKVAIRYTAILLHGVSFSVATAMFTTHGRAGKAEALVAYRAQVLYIIQTFLYTKVHGAPNTSAVAEAQALTRITSSITIAAPAGPPTPP
jgi:hypothetical protein